MKTHTWGKDDITTQLLGLMLLMGGCSVSTDNGPDCRYNEAWLSGECSVEITSPLVWPAGTWRGADAQGRNMLLLISAGGTFQFFSATLSTCCIRSAVFCALLAWISMAN
jgi:hypothetical protein